jgi:hypothetical protein
MRCKYCPFYKTNSDQSFCWLGKCISVSGKCIVLGALKERIKYRMTKLVKVR